MKYKHNVLNNLTYPPIYNISIRQSFLVHSFRKNYDRYHSLIFTLYTVNTVNTVKLKVILSCIVYFILHIYIIYIPKYYFITDHITWTQKQNKNYIIKYQNCVWSVNRVSLNFKKISENSTYVGSQIIYV